MAAVEEMENVGAGVSSEGTESAVEGGVEARQGEGGESAGGDGESGEVIKHDTETREQGKEKEQQQQQGEEQGKEKEQQQQQGEEKEEEKEQEQGEEKEEEKEQEQGEEKEEKREKQCATGSIYLEDGAESCQHVPPSTKPRRLTRAERARQETLAAFGGTDLASVPIKKRDLRDELQRDAEAMKQRTEQGGANRVKHKSRLATAREETSKVFKDMPFGEKASRKRKLSPVEDTDTGSNPKPAHRMTRAERAKQDALKSFGGCGFDMVMGGAKRKVARTLKPRQKKKESEEVEKEGSSVVES